MTIEKINPVYIDKRGYRVIKHRPMTFDEHCMAYPSEVLFKGKKASLYISPIPYDENYTTIVYFVTGYNGDEFGQFNNRSSAFDAFRKVEESHDISIKQ